MRLTCVVDNCAGASDTWAEHGLAVHIRTPQGQLLWDTGATGALLWHNLCALGIDVAALSAVALSHAHDDHTGGLAELLARRPGLTVHAHRAIFQPRWSRRQGQYHEIGLTSRETTLRAAGNWCLSDEPVALLPAVRTSGSIGERLYPVSGAEHLFVERDGQRLPDDYADDQALFLTTGQGVVLLCGCCHAGLRNTLLALRRQTAAPLVAIVGGTHLRDSAPAELQAIIAGLKAEGLPRLYLNHCTGQAAMFALWRELGDCVQPYPTGTVLDF
jgi:7,8-dihydropterin-6-yl-methyl-4-(beta-D-ribofuranosyl)aminobenzene 5'-phosphate synthase